MENKIFIHFKEAGEINFFPEIVSKYGNESLRFLCPNEFQIDYDILFSKDTDKRINYLEEYLLNLYSPNSSPQIEKAVELLMNDPSLLVKDVAEKISMNKKTFNRQFKKHIGCTASQFKKLYRFKKVARDYFEKGDKKLVELCYENGFYDASDFYKQILKATSQNPKEFFRNASLVGPKKRILIVE